MHDGSVRSLAEVVEFYDRGGVPNPTLDIFVMPLELTDDELKDLVAFLETLTDHKFLTNPALSNPLSNPDMREELKRGGRTKSDPPEWLTGSH